MQLAYQRSYRPAVQRVEPCFYLLEDNLRICPLSLSSFLVCKIWLDDWIPLQSPVLSHLHIIVLASLACKKCRRQHGLMSNAASYISLTCESSVRSRMCRKSLNMLTSTRRCSASPTHMTLQAWSEAACQSVCMYAASGWFWARPRATAELVCWKACGSWSWMVHRPAERVRCVKYPVNEFPWPAEAVGWAY